MLDYHRHHDTEANSIDFFASNSPLTNLYIAGAENQEQQIDISLNVPLLSWMMVEPAAGYKRQLAPL